MSHEPELARVATDLIALEHTRAAGELDDDGREKRRSGIAELLRLLERGPSAERRKHVRIPADLEVRLRIQEVAASCVASELSHSGLGLRGELWVEEGAMALVENLRVGTRDYPMSVRAQVVWKTAGTGAGLTFLDLDEDNQRQIRSVFEQLFWLYVERLAGS
jgi:hypothetical protein